MSFVLTIINCLLNYFTIALNKIKKYNMISNDNQTVTTGKGHKRRKHYNNNVTNNQIESKQSSSVNIKRCKTSNSNWKAFTTAHNLSKVPKNITSNKPPHKIMDNINLEQTSGNSKVRSLPCVAIDCEMVGVGYKGKENMLARVSLVNEKSVCIYDTFVKPLEPVTDYRTFVSGVRPENMKNGKPFQQVQQEVSDLIKDKILIGHAIKTDLQVLYIKHPQKLIRDTSKIKKFREFTNGQKPSLKKLAEKILGRTIQTGEHSSVEDARATMDVYKKFKNEVELEFLPKHLKKYKMTIE